MQNKAIKILVLFVEPMLYGMDLIHEVYEQTEYEFKYVYCYQGLTGKDGLKLPKNSYLNSGNKRTRRRNLLREIKNFDPSFMVINGYVGLEQTIAIRYCQRQRIPYAIETDTPLHIPGNPVKAFLKKTYLSSMLNNKYCYGFPGGTLQKENLVYYGISENKCFIMPMSVSEKRLLNVSKQLSDKETLKSKYNLTRKKVFLFVGRLESVKNVSLLLRAYETLKTKRNDIALIIVGDGTESEDLKAYVAEKKLKDVLFMGYVIFPQIVEFYKLSDVFVLPSSYEPWGLVVNEAMIMGLPVIVSSAVGCREDLVKNGVNGVVFECTDESSLLQQMDTVIGEKKDLFAQNSRRTVTAWNYNLYLQQFKGAIKNVIQS